MAGSREAAEPGDATDASGDADGHGLELILDHVSWLGQVIAEEQLTDEPGAQGTVDVSQPGNPSSPFLLCISGPGRVLSVSGSLVTGPRTISLPSGARSAHPT